MLVRVHRQPVFDLPFRFGFDRDFEDLFTGLLGGTEQVARVPRINVAENKEQYLISAEVPGITREELKISVQDGHLTLSGERKSPDHPEEANWLRSEINVGRFSRTLPLPGEVKVEEISAELKDGILTLVLPKSEKARAREISVK